VVPYWVEASQNEAISSSPGASREAGNLPHKKNSLSFDLQKHNTVYLSYIVYWRTFKSINTLKKCFCFKGSLTPDFSLQVFLMNQFPPGP
jgi:hypothetical protein